MTKENESQIIKAYRLEKDEKKKQLLLEQLIEQYKEHIKIQARMFANKYKQVLENSMVETQDLEQQGVLGFVKSLKSFDPDRGYWLGTYATFYMKKEMSIYTERNVTLFSLPSKSLNAGIFKYMGVNNEDTNYIDSKSSNKASINPNALFMKEMKQDILEQIEERRNDSDGKRQISDFDVKIMKDILCFDAEDYDSFIDGCTDYITSKKLYIKGFRRNKAIIECIKKVVVKHLK